MNSASKPRPIFPIKYLELTFPTSINSCLFRAMILRQLFSLKGILKCLAIPLPDPSGIIPSFIFVPIKRLPISFTVPSPPQATTEVAFSSIAFFVNFIACPLYSD